MPTATCTPRSRGCRITTTITFTSSGFSQLRRGERIAPRVLAPGRITLLRAQAGPLAGDHDRVEIVVESGSLTVEPVAANVALPGPERTRLELDATVREDARLILEDAPLIVAEGADVLRTVTIRLAPGAVVIVRDVVVLGRAGEGPGRLESVLRCDEILYDALRVEPSTWAQDAYVVLAPGHRAIGTYVRLGMPGNLEGPGHLERVSAASAADVEAACKAWRRRDGEEV